jgi:threonine dehydrogenase-like Zn-dependent dehydrogenase
MPRELFVDKPRHLVIQEYEDLPLQATQVRIRTEFSAIKHGTEFHLFSGKSPFASMMFDEHLRMFVERSSDAPAQSYMYPGNISVGSIIEVGSAVRDFQVGERVYTYAPIRQTITKNSQEIHPLPAQMNASDAVCTDPAFFALAAVRDAKVSVGDNVVLFGLGAIGLFCIQLLHLAGCLEIIAVDPIPKRRDLAMRFGATLVLDPDSEDIGQEIHRYLKQGADIAIEGSGSYRALHDAMRSVQMCGRVVTFGYYKGTAADLALGAEWHHNRLTLVSSMPVWNNPFRDHPLWNEQRLKAAVRRMFVQKLLTSDGIVDPIVDFENTPEAYLDIYHNPEQAIKLGVRYGAMTPLIFEHG